MRSMSNPWIRGAKHCLAALAIVAVLGLAAPSANASVGISVTATNGSNTYTGSGSESFASGTQTVGNFSIQVTVNTNDPGNSPPFNQWGFSSQATNTFAVFNNGPTTDTITIQVIGSNYTVQTYNTASYTVSGTSTKFNTSLDSVGVSSSVNSTPIPPSAGLTGAPVAPSVGNTATYSFTNGGASGVLAFTNNHSTFSMTQNITITLAKGDSVNLTFTNTVLGSPEPSSMALAGLGALGLIGYGIRRRKARTA